MTICEAFRDSYLTFKENEIKARAKAQGRINAEIEVGSKQFVEVFFKYWDMFYDYELLNMGITQEQLRNACENGFIQKKEWSNWKARQLGQTRGYRITAKGVKALYKTFDGQW